MQANILSLFSKVLESKSEGFMLLTKPFARILIRFFFISNKDDFNYFHFVCAHKIGAIFNSAEKVDTD